MTNDEYDRLLVEIRKARIQHVNDAWKAADSLLKLNDLLRELDREESRIAREALASMHSASRKLVVGE